MVSKTEWHVVLSESGAMPPRRLSLKPVLSGALGRDLVEGSGDVARMPLHLGQITMTTYSTPVRIEATRSCTDMFVHRGFLVESRC